MSDSLPAHPSLDQLKKQAKELLQSLRAQDPNALALFTEHHPAKLGPNQSFALHDAQLILARQHGFASWPKLREEVERRTSDFQERAARFASDAGKNNLTRAKRALALEPGLASATFWTQLVTGDLTRIRAAVGKTPAVALEAGGPNKKWTPLLYLSFSGFQMENQETQARFTECAKVLLDAGADVNAAWEHEQWPGSPLRPLYGATGANNNPSLARLLIERGAELNDGESIYHSAQYYHLECMELLREAGVSLGLHPHWKNTPLYFILGVGPNLQSWTTAAKGVRWLLDHGSDPNIPCGDEGETALQAALRLGHSEELVRWLLEAGANPNQANKEGLTPLTVAHLTGRRDLVSVLKEYGAGEVSLTPRQHFFEAAFSEDEELFQSILRDYPDIATDLTEEEKLALNRAAERGKTTTVRLLLDAGFDIAFKGTREWGSTPLHIASWHGQAEVVELLLSRGAPLDIPANKPEESFPLGWAAHGSGNCRNPTGDYPRTVRALLNAGAEPFPQFADMSSSEVAEIFYAATAGKE